MASGNTRLSYGRVTRGFHWLTALLILSAIPLGLVGADLAQQLTRAGGAADQGLIDRTMLVFSLHKTIGITAFFTALARILWALGQPKPGLIHGDRKAEALAAEIVHWLLYGSMLLVPLSGWISHAAHTGGAPIWWPFGQGLLLVPKSEAIAQAAAHAHDIGKSVLILAILLHVAGAIKHHVLDRDATLRRMWTGEAATTVTAQQPGHLLPAAVALVVLAGAYGSTALDLIRTPDTAAPAATTTGATTGIGNWQVVSGTLAITVQQMGGTVEGRFAAWTADIAYAPGPDGPRGAVTVTIPVSSLSLGSVSEQAMTPDYFDATAFPTATVTADLIQAGDRLTAEGLLTIKDQSVPVSFPVDLTLTGDDATASGALTLDRRRFDIGTGVQDPGTLGFDVGVRFEVTATRAAAAAAPAD